MRDVCSRVGPRGKLGCPGRSGAVDVGSERPRETLMEAVSEEAQQATCLMVRAARRLRSLGVSQARASAAAAAVIQTVYEDGEQDG